MTTTSLPVRLADGRTQRPALTGLPASVTHLRAQLDEPDWTGAAPGPASDGLGIDLENLGKSYGARTVLGGGSAQGLNLRIEPGEFVAIVGRSGCGKSTLLRLIAGLEAASTGHIRLDGQPQAQHRHNTRIMFQDARLLPWKRVLDNVMLGLRGEDVQERAYEALTQVGLADRARDWPAVLSGGQRQRVALARALVHAPRLLLLDEPLGALDALTRIEMHRLIESLWETHGFTAVLVTHDVSEAVALADRVLLVEEGQITLDRRIDLPRSRSHTQPGFATIEDEVLRRVLQQPGEEVPAPVPELHTLRWAI